MLERIERNIDKFLPQGVRAAGCAVVASKHTATLPLANDAGRPSGVELAPGAVPWTRVLHRHETASDRDHQQTMLVLDLDAAARHYTHLYGVPRLLLTAACLLTMVVCGVYIVLANVRIQS